MFIVGNNAIGKGGFVPAANKGYLLTATGEPPITLTKPLKKEPESIVITGASGGVGDWDTTKNIFGAYVDSYAGGVTITSLTDNELRFTTTRDGACYVHLFYPVTAGQTYTLYGTVSSCCTSIYRNSQSNANLIAKAIDISSGYEYTADFTGNLLVRVYSASGSTAGQDCAVTNAALYGCYKIPILINPPVLPNGYTKLKYIEATGTQYIDTGFSPDQNTRVDYKVRFAQGALSASPLIGARVGDGSTSRFMPIAYDLANTVFRSVYGMATVAGTVDFDTDYIGSYQPKNTRTIINGMSYALRNPNFIKTENYNLYLFATSGYGDELYLSSGRMYYCRIYNNGTLIRNFVPAKRNSDGVVGMYDTINGVFYTNADSSGDNFIAGAEIPHKTINLYSDSALGVNESLTVNPKTHEATKHDDTSVAGLQDWSQDFKLPKSDSVTVTADTTVAPRNIEIQYWSRAKTAESGTRALPSEVTYDEEPILYDDAETDSLDEAEPNDPDPYPLIER